jgi:acylphosphatase
MSRRHVKFSAASIAVVKNLRKNVVDEARRLQTPFLGWIRNNKDGTVELLIEGPDDRSLASVVAFALSEAERWLGVVVQVEEIASAKGDKPLKAFDVGHSGSPI